MYKKDENVMQSFKNNGEMEKESLKLCEINLEMKKKEQLLSTLIAQVKKRTFKTNFKKNLICILLKQGFFVFLF